jgi:subfamily B ATP-binding cassette protein HlyB/CyaB
VLSHLYPASASKIAQTINRLKGKVTMLFIAHQLPTGLQVDGVVKLESAQPSKWHFAGDLTKEQMDGSI